MPLDGERNPSQQNSERARGYKSKGDKGGGKGKGKRRPTESRSVDDRKKTGPKCSSCGQRGHWHGDASCPNVINGTDRPREQSQANYNATEERESPASGSGGPKTHRVNWTFMVNNDGWELLRGYHSEEDSDDSSSEEDQSPDPVLLAAPRDDKSRSSKDRQRRYKVALKTVLEALAAEAEDDDTKKKLKKKDISRQGKRKTVKGKDLRKGSHQQDQVMETDMSPHEILQILPYMSSVEKKELYRALKQEQENEAMKYMDPEATAEKMKRRERRTTGYSAGRPGVPKYSPAKSSKDEEPAAPEGKAHSNLPEPVRQKRLAEFRRTLFENSLDKKGRVRPSEAADFPDASQERCEHLYESCGGEPMGRHIGPHCRKCKLKRVLYYSTSTEPW